MLATSFSRKSRANEEVLFPNADRGKWCAGPRFGGESDCQRKRRRPEARQSPGLDSCWNPGREERIGEPIERQ
jgi:hypothetical protein